MLVHMHSCMNRVATLEPNFLKCINKFKFNFKCHYQFSLSYFFSNLIF